MPRHTTPLHLYLLGAPEVRLGAKLLTFPTRKTLALLIYLALQGGEQPREYLAALLWPEASPERSHASLRNTLSHLQRALRLAHGQLKTAYLSVTHHTLALNPDADIQLDLRVVERAYSLARGDRGRRAPPEGSASQPVLESAVAYYRGDFLAGFSLGDAPGFDDWTGSQREVWRRRLGLIFDRLSEIQFASGEFANATETAAHWIALDPLNEAAYRRKMRAHFAAGERGPALEAYAACQAVLAAELSTEPDPETEALAIRIRRQHANPPLASRPDTPAAFLENLFAGRAAEYQTLIEGYKRTAAGQPQAGTLHGEAGIGKTRLATEFLAWAGAQGCEVMQGCALESSGHLPFQPLVEALRLRIERESALKDWLGEAWLAPLSELWPELRERYPELPLAPKERPPLKAAAGRTQLFEAVVRLTLAWAQRTPVVLFVDDLQWADSATLDWLQYAVRRWRESAARIMLLVSLRPEVLHPLAPPATGGLREWLARVTRELKPCSLFLEPLSERDTTQMVLSILRPPVADFAQWVFDETRGQPFYLMETLKDLLERGVLHPKRQAKGQWTFGVDAEHDLGRAVRVPSTVRAVMRARLSRLSPKAFTLLAAGAVLEQQLTFDRLCAIANLPEDAGLPALDELVSGQLLLEAAPPGGASVYTFANDMLRNVVYTEAGDARRQLFHRRALEVLEAAGVPAAVLVHHALAAGLAEASVRHSLAAGREALRLSALAEALVHCRQARQLFRDVSPVRPEFELQIHDLYWQLGQAYEAGGQPAQAQAVYLEWEETAPRL